MSSSNTLSGEAQVLLVLVLFLPPVGTMEHGALCQSSFLTI